MTIEKIGLGKLLKIFGAKEADRLRLIRVDLREEKAKKDSQSESGPDFYGPFWADAKAHVAGRSDLYETTKQRIVDLLQRKMLYALLRDGFLNWLDLTRRETNQPLVPTERNFHSKFEFPDLHLVLKVHNVMGLQGEDGRARLVYPFFCKHHRLTDEWARVGLWLMSQAFTEFDLDELEILDVMNGTGFHGRNFRLNGDEEEIFRVAYKRLHAEWTKLSVDYGL